MEEEEAPSHLNQQDEEEEAAADASSDMSMSMDDEQPDHRSKEEVEEEQAADPWSSHPTEEGQGGRSMEEAEENEDEEEEDRWDAYLRSQRSPDTFAQYYRCRPMSLLGRDTADYDDGNRVVMPQSALERLSAVEVEYPMVFRIQNAATLQASHVGVQEFVADEGFVHVPTRTTARLGLHDGGLVLLTSTSLPKAASVRLQPHTSDFLRVRHPKELLEYNFGKYTCVTVGDTITVVEGERRYLLDVVDAQPARAVSTIETDCEVDFLPPLDYVEPAPRVSVPAPVVKVAATGQGDASSVVVGVRMDGKPVERPAPAKVVAVAGQGDGRFSHAGVRMDGKPVEPAPTVPVTGPLEKATNATKNVLRFGAGTSMASAVKAGQKADAGEKANQAGGFTGKKYSPGD